MQSHRTLSGHDLRRYSCGHSRAHSMASHPYQRTHPWITFQVDLRGAGSDLWLLLGEAASKCEHLARVPLRPATAELLHRIYLAKGAAATTAIEGNTLSEAEVLEAVDGTLRVPTSKAYLKQEVDNVIAAFNGIGQQVA